MTINDKREKIARILSEHYGDADWKVDVIDLVADLKHFIRGQAECLPFDEIDRVTEMHLDAEIMFDEDEELY